MAKEWITRYPCDPHYWDWWNGMKWHTSIAREELFWRIMPGHWIMCFLICAVASPYGVIIASIVVWGYIAILWTIIWYMPVPFENLQNFTLIQGDE